MPANPAVWGLATVCMTSAFSASSTFLPSLTEVRKASANDPVYAGDVRLGEGATCLVSTSFGLVCSSLSGSAVPAFVGLAVGLLLAALYEHALRTDIGEEVAKRGQES